MAWGDIVAQYPWLANQYVQAGIWIVLTLLIAKLFKDVFVAVVRSLTKKTKSDLDDMILELSASPLFFLIVTAGLYLTLRPLTFFQNRPELLYHIFFVIGVGIVAWMTSRVLGFLIKRWFKAHREVEGTPKLLNLIISIVIYLGALIVVLSYFRIEFTPIIAALGVGGLAVGLALQDTLSNIFAGIHIISDQPIRIKDFIEVEGGVSGWVKDIGWRSTRIETFDNNIVIIPNSKLASSIITNANMPNQAIKTVVICGVDYGSDLTQVEKVSLAVAKEMQKKVEGATPDFEPVFRYYEFGDNNVNFKVVLGAKTRGDKFLLAHEYMKALHVAFAKEGVDISWPIRKVYDAGKFEPPKKSVQKSPKRVQKRVKKDDDMD